MMATVNIDGQKLLSFTSRVDILVKALQEIVEKSEEWQESDRDAKAVPWWNLGDKAKAALIEFSKTYELEV